MNPPRILIAEDNGIQALGLRNMLAGMGYEVVGQAAEGQEVVDLALCERPDIVLMDIKLIGTMSGIEAAESIHAQQDIPIIFLTAFNYETLVDQAKASGAYAFLTKPVRPQELRASLEMSLNKHAAEKHSQQLNQVLWAIRDVNKLIHRAVGAQQLIEEAVAILLKRRGYRFAWFGKICESAPSVQAWAGEGITLLERILQESTAEQRTQFPPVQAALQRQIVICHDMRQDGRCSSWKSEIEQAQFRSMVSLPVIHQESLFGVLSVYAAQTNRFDQEEVDLLSELASDIAFGLKAHSEQTERQQAEEAMRRSEAKYRAVIENSYDGIVFTDQEGKIRYRSSSFYQMTGYTAEERLGKNGFESVHPDDLAAWRIIWDQMLQNPGKTYNWEYRTRHKDGSEVWIESTVQSLVDDPSVQEVIITSRNITERKKAEVAIRQRNTELTVLNQIGQALNKVNKLEQLLELIFNEVGRVLDNRNLFIALYDEEHKYITFPVYSLHGERIQGRSRPLGSGFTDYIIRNGQPVLVRQDLAGYLEEHGIELIGTLSKSFIAVPMISEKKVTGVIALQDYDLENVYDEHHLELLTTIAAQAAVALQNARLFSAAQQELEERKRAIEALRISEQTAQKTAEQLRMVNQIGYAIETGLDMEHLLHNLYEQCQQIGDTDTFYVALFDEESSILRFPFYYKAGERRYPQSRNLNESKGVSGLVINQRKTLYLGDLNNLPEWVSPILQPGPQILSYIGIPLISGDRVIGVFSMQSARANAYSSEQIRTLELLATQIAIAIQNSQLFEEIQREKKLAEAVVDNLPGVFTLINREGRILRWNKFAELNTGFSTAEIRNMTILDLVAEPDRSRIAGLLPEVFEKDQINLETKLRCKNNAEAIPIYLTSSRAQIGEDTFIVSIAMDITERKQHENELQAIAGLSTALRTAPTRVEMLPVIIQHIQSLLHCDSVTIQMIDQQTGDSVVEAASGVWNALIGSHQGKDIGIDAVIRQTLQPYLTHDLENDPLTFPQWIKYGIHGAIGVPLIAQGNLIGFIWSGSQMDFGTADLRMLSAIADIAANAIYRATLHEQTRHDAEELAQAYDTTLEGWANALELRDQETVGHTRRVTEMCVELAKRLGQTGNALEDIRRGALLHDIGKMGIPDSVLLKPGTLNEREWELMRRHPEYALRMLSKIPYLRASLDICYAHHEKWDGSGYPRGLKGEAIPLQARIFTVVDVWDALTSDRPYRKAWTHEDAVKYIRQMSGVQFDPKIVEVFLDMLNQG